MDRGGDIVMPGAFKASLADWKKRKALPPMLWQHDPALPDRRLDRARGGREGPQGRPASSSPACRRRQIAARLMQGRRGQGPVDRLSQPDDYEIDRATGARQLKKVDLWEISPVTFPMLPEAGQISASRAISIPASWSARSAPKQVCRAPRP
jgi:HK97 family phage prohead protease